MKNNVMLSSASVSMKSNNSEFKIKNSYLSCDSFGNTQQKYMARYACLWVMSND